MLKCHDPIAAFDADVGAALKAERSRQECFLELIASENYASERVLEAQGSVLTNKYANGFPGRREYSGCEPADAVETLAVERAKRLFDAAYANVQPYSGTQANAAVYAALLAPGDTVLGMRATDGGHITHGDAKNFSGRYFRGIPYGVDAAGDIAYEEVAELARAHRPRMIVAGFSAYSRIIDWRRFRAIADEVGAYFLADMAHVAGLVAAGLYPSPVALADVTTTTTHKTLRGPRGGMILAREALLGARLDAGVYPDVQGSPLMHVIAAKAVALKEAMTPEFRLYQQRVLANARCLAEVLARRGFPISGGRTDNHMVIIDLGNREVVAKELEKALESAHIAVNAVHAPGRSSPAAPPTAIRMGTPAVTTRGLRETEIERLAHWIADVCDASGSDAVVARVRAEVLEMCSRFPVYGGSRAELAPTAELAPPARAHVST